MKTDTPRTAAELEELVRSGDQTITADDIANARIQDEFKQMRAEAKSRAELAAIEAERNADIAKLRADIDNVEADTIAEQLAAAQDAITALDRLVDAGKARVQLIADLGARARQLGIPELVNDQPNHPSDIGWRRDPGGPVTKLRAGDRVVYAADPGTLLAKLVDDYVSKRRLTRAKVPTTSLHELIASQDKAITPPVMRTIRVVRRWGQHRPGALVTVDLDSASWAVGHGFGESLIQPEG